MYLKVFIEKCLCKLRFLTLTAKDSSINYSYLALRYAKYMPYNSVSLSGAGERFD